jgi:cyclic-di-GMP phosphodiesterase TipF (flagellum assembly factor)
VAGAQTLVQSLVYIFIALGALGVGGAAYFGFTFSPIEAFVTAILFAVVAVVVQERALRRRAESRLEKAIEDLSRLLSTDAQAGAVLSQRINTLTDADAGRRLEGVEADISVLGTVIRQVAEAVAELDEARRPTRAPVAPTPVVVDEDKMSIAPLDEVPDSVIPLEALSKAIDRNRLIFHVAPVVILPLRRPQGYDLVPRLLLDKGDMADPPDFMPRQGGEIALRRIERLAADEAMIIARRARTAGVPIILYLPLSRATLSDGASMEQIMMVLDENRALAQSLIFSITESDWNDLDAMEKAAIASLVKRGAGISLLDATSLRLDYADLAGLGVRSIRVDAERFIDDPETFSDFHTSDIAKYTRRFGIEILATGIRNEQQIIVLLEDGLTLVQGPHIGKPGPVRSDLMVDRMPAEIVPRRAEA